MFGSDATINYTFLRWHRLFRRMCRSRCCCLGGGGCCWSQKRNGKMNTTTSKQHVLSVTTTIVASIPKMKSITRTTKTGMILSDVGRLSKSVQSLEQANNELFSFIVASSFCVGASKVASSMSGISLLSSSFATSDDWDDSAKYISRKEFTKS